MAPTHFAAMVEQYVAQVGAAPESWPASPLLAPLEPLVPDELAPLVPDELAPLVPDDAPLLLVVPEVPLLLLLLVLPPSPEDEVVPLLLPLLSLLQPPLAAPSRTSAVAPKHSPRIIFIGSSP